MSRRCAGLVVLCLIGCGGSMGDPDGGADVMFADPHAPADARAENVALSLGPAYRLRDNLGRSSVDSTAAGGSDDGVLVATVIGERLLARRFTASGVLLDEVDIELDILPQARVLSVTGGDEGWLVSWLNHNEQSLHHSWVRADGTVSESLAGGPLADMERLVMVRRAEDEVWSWVTECDFAGGVASCVIARRISPLDGSPIRSVEVIPAFNSRYAAPVVGSMTNAGGAIAWQVAEPGEIPSMRLQFLGADAAPEGSEHPLGPGAPQDIAVHADGAVVLTSANAIVLASDGSTVATQPRAYTRVVATTDGYHLLQNTEEAFAVARLSPTGVLASSCTFDDERQIGTTTELAGTGDGSLAIWVGGEESPWGDSEIRAGRATETCEEAGHWRTPYSAAYEGRVRTAWIGDSGLALISPGDTSTPAGDPLLSPREVRVLGVDGSVSAPRVLPSERVDELISTDSAYWLRYRNHLVVLDVDGSVIRDVPLSSQVFWLASGGYRVTAMGETRVEFQRVDGQFDAIGEPQQVTLSSAVFEMVPADDGRFWVGGFESSAIVDASTGEVLLESSDLQLGQGYSCGDSCWVRVQPESSERFAWRDGALERTALPAVAQGRGITFGSYLAIVDQSLRVHLYDRRSMALHGSIAVGEEPVVPPGAAPPLAPHLSTAPRGGLSVGYHSDNEAVRASFFRFIEVDET